MALLLRTTGTETGEVLQAGSGGVELRGLGGNDTLFGGPDVDSLNGNTDSDIVTGSGNDSVFGGTGNDTVIGTGSGDRVLGNKGNDIVIGSGTLFGGQDQDTLFGGAVGNGDLGDDLIYTGVTADGGEGNDTLVGNTGSNTFIGGVGNDQFIILPQEVRGVAPGTAAATVTVGGYGGTDTITDFQAGPGTGDILKLVDLDNLSVVKIAQTGTDVTVTVSGTAFDANTANTQNAAETVVIKNIALRDFMSSGSDDLEVNGVFVSTSNAAAVAPGDTEYLYNVGTEVIGRNIVGTAQGDQITANSVGLPNTTFNNDTVFGDNGDDLIDGLAGNDSLTANSGNDTVRGGSGDDFISGGLGTVSKTRLGSLVVGSETAAGSDELFGEDGNDTVVGEDLPLSTAGDQADFISGGAGADSLLGQVGDDTILGGTGDDTINTGVDNDYANGNEGNDLIIGGNDATPYYTTAAGFGNASVSGLQSAANGRLFDDVLIGAAGDDTILAGEGTDYVSGGDNDDSLSGEGGDDVIVGLAGNDYGSGGLGDDSVLGGDDNDSLYGNDSEDTVRGQAGDDSLIGGEGSDLLEGGTGADFIDGSSPDLLFTVSAKAAALNNVDTAANGLPFAVTGANLADANDTALFAVFPDGVVGDVASYANAGGSVTVNLSTASASGADGTDTLKDIEHVVGGNSSDVLTGDAGANLLYGGAGDDTLDGLAGNDYLAGAGGVDSIFGNTGDDTINGGAGDDSITGGTGNDSILAAAGDDDVSGGDGDDTVVSTADNDDIVGNDGADRIFLDSSLASRVAFLLATDGSDPGVNSGFDVITGFAPGDQIQMGDGLFIDLNDVFANSTLDVTTKVTDEINADLDTFGNPVPNPFTGDEVVFLTSAIVGGLADPGFANVIAAIGSVRTDALGDDVLIFANNGTDTGIYYYRNTTNIAGVADTDALPVANEISLLGTVNGVIGQPNSGSFVNTAFNF